MGSSIYRKLSVEELDRVVSHHFPATGGYRAVVLKGGRFNTTYKLDVNDSSYVLRVGPVNRGLLLPFEHNLMNAENRVCSLLKAAHIPCSDVIACETAKTLLDRDYMICRYIPGKTMDSSDITEREETRLYVQLGEYVRAMHALSARKFGRISSMLNDQSFSTWGGYLCDEMETTIRLSTQRGILDRNAGERILQLFSDAKPLFNKITEPKLVHADLWEGNVIVTADNQRIAAIIDTDRAMFGDPEFDFASPWATPAPLFDGYGSLPSDSAESQRRRTLYTMFYCVLDSYVWKVEYNNNAECDKSRTMLLDLLKRLEA